jgi:hypothetical protein
MIWRRLRRRELRRAKKDRADRDDFASFLHLGFSCDEAPHEQN